MKYALLVSAALLASPALAQKTPDALLGSFVASVEAEDAAGLAALYLDDADSYGPGGDISKGRAAIAATWTGFFDAFDDFSVEIEKHGERESRRMHAAWGLFTMSAAPVGGGERVVWKGRFTDVSVKTGDGWRYVVDHASMLAPPGDAGASAQP